MSEYACPSCKSTDVMKASMAWQAGTSHSTSGNSGVGVGVMGGHLAVGVGGGKSKGKSMTVLAQRFAPPQKANKGGIYFALFIGAIFIGAWVSKVIWPWLVWPVVLGGWLYLCIKMQGKIDTAHNIAMGVWGSKWFCQRCGEVGLDKSFNATAAVQPLLDKAQAS